LPSLEEHLKVLKAATADGSESDTVHECEHLEFLIKFIKSEHAELLEEINSLQSNGEITHKLAWANFVPRTILFTACPVSGTPRAVRFLQMHATLHGWTLDVEYVEHNPNANRKEERYGLATINNIALPSFQGAVKITSLPAYPMRFCLHEDELKKKFMERGKKWCSLQGTHHRFYHANGFQKG